LKIVVKIAASPFAQLLFLIVPAIAIGSAVALGMAISPASPGAPDPAMAHSPGIQQIDTALIRPTPAGRELFVQSCAHCHGDDARGSGDGPDLYGLRTSNARIGTVIRQGIHGEMPSFAKKHSASDIAALITYLRTLR
jgi:mono/diheme cytochrome c family protein